MAKRQDGMHVIRAGGAVLQNPPVFMDRKVAAARIMRFFDSISSFDLAFAESVTLEPRS